MRRAFLCLLWIGLLLLARPAPAEELAKDEARTIRAVIQAQLDAFKADDAKRAFSYASPGIQQQFGTAEHFMALVRAHYAMVVRPSSVSFLQAQRIDGEVQQPVRVTDATGTSWLVVYQMEQQRDRSWRIAGCQAVQQAVRRAWSPRAAPSATAGGSS